MVAIPKSKTDREDEARKKRISILITPLLKELGVFQQMTLLIGFYDELPPLNDSYPGLDERTVFANVADGYPYRTIDISFCRHAVDDASDDTLLQSILHEVLHPVIFGDMRRVVSDQGFLRTKRGKLVWGCLEEHAVDLLALWIAGFWNEIRAKEEKKRKRTPKQVA